jgi:hypothetical protein
MRNGEQEISELGFRISDFATDSYCVYDGSPPIAWGFAGRERPGKIRRNLIKVLINSKNPAQIELRALAHILFNAEGVVQHSPELLRNPG